MIAITHGHYFGIPYRRHIYCRRIKGYGVVSRLRQSGVKQGFVFFRRRRYQFASAKVSGELSYSFSLFQVKTKLGYSHVHRKDPLWDLSFYGSIRGKFGRFSAKFAWTDVPAVWTYTFSWNLKYGFAMKPRE